jgi:glycosyltransferase involved in cell wall biosynthesis
MIDVIIPVYNGANVIDQTLDALLQQSQRGSIWQRILVVDDGSVDDTAERVSAYAAQGVELLRAPHRSGRANARNRGAQASRAEWLLFLDADCMPAHADLLSRYAALGTESDRVCLGRIEGRGPGFWQRFAVHVADGRERRAAAGDWLGFTSCNLCVSRRLFDAAGRFHPGYRHYGFEDRDLLVRLQAAGGRFVQDRSALVLHDVDTSVAELCAKLRTAGEHSAAEFRQRFPDVYRHMPYARFDVQTASMPIRIGAPLLAAIAPWAEAWADRLLRSALPGDAIRRVVLRIATALAYLQGTRRNFTQ